MRDLDASADFHATAMFSGHAATTDTWTTRSERSTQKWPFYLTVISLVTTCGGFWALIAALVL